MHALILFLALGAPAPSVKAKPAPVLTQQALLGDWDCEWNGTACVMAFGKGGGYYCLWMGVAWTGTWTFEDGTLTVEEWEVNSDRPRLKWSARMTGPRQGEMGLPGYINFRLFAPGTLIKRLSL